MSFLRGWWVWISLACCLPAMPACAQHPGGGGGGMPMGMPGRGMPMGGGPGFPGGPGGMPGNREISHSRGGPPPNGPDSAGTVSAMRGGLQLGPPGRWWDDKHFAKDLKLRTEQQRRMDSIFESNRPALLKSLQDVQLEEGRMEQLVHGKGADEPSLDAQIDRVWQARASLEKAKTHYLLQIRGQMDSDQIARLEDHR